jgi:TonB family protein
MKYGLLVATLLTMSLHLHAQILASAKPPAYPLAARAEGIDGPVVLKAIISKEGKVQNISVISGWPELRQAAIDAVQAWTYKPYTHLGHSVEVHTTVTVNFNMGTGKKKAAEQAKAQALLAQSAQPAHDNLQPPAPKQENPQPPASQQ